MSVLNQILNVKWQYLKIRLKIKLFNFKTCSCAFEKSTYFHLIHACWFNEIYRNYIFILCSFYVMCRNKNWLQSVFLSAGTRTCFATCIDRGGLLDFALLSVVKLFQEIKQKSLFILFSGLVQPWTKWDMRCYYWTDTSFNYSGTKMLLRRYLKIQVLVI